MSVVMTVRNGERFISRAIKSVLDQKYSHLELIITDGGSTDGTLNIIRSFGDVAYYSSEPDDGIYDGMNKGIAMATGSIIKILNADDELAPGSIQSALEKFQSGRAGIVIGSIGWIGSDSQLIETTHPFLGRPPSFAHPSWYVHRRVYEALGLYSTDFRISGDYEFFRRSVGADVQFETTDKVLVMFRTDGASSGYRGAFESFRIDRFYDGLPGAIGGFLRRLLKRVRFRALLMFLSPTAAHRLRVRLKRILRSKADG